MPAQTLIPPKYLVSGSLQRPQSGLHLTRFRLDCGMIQHRLIPLFAILAATLLTFMSTPATAEEAGVYRHVVLFKFKESATPDQVQAVEAAFKSLPSKIDTITGFEWGTNVSPEGKDDGFTHCFFLTFKDKAGLEVYIPHPDHQAFGALLRPILDKVLVIDYTAQK